MPTPSIPITLSAKSASLTVGTYVTFYNLTRSGKKRIEASGGEAVTTAPSDWEEGDTIVVQVTGKYNNSSTATISKGGIKPALTLTEDTSTPSISL